MFRLKVAFRKLRLQRKQLKNLRTDKNHARYSEQQEVLRLLLGHPSVLFSTERKDTSSNHLYKYVNGLLVTAKNDKMYRYTLRLLENE
ncbi:hypothetical protein [Enterococcus malodoratus]|uniref:Uncharacterized protein n=1 Tax=Enterococcus malodoratus ATCC 43197 TaxID=1158601 RepID=R2NXF2_9ENTE|nr:hypothetical protein [Enterococcus malodoratus]EOH75723.1 hypothetical protein UAI_02732 [Enterococcus malodoratus ATCC 43197]EOT67550.1 hypothetical protein I585_03071 [Enterococcus malodoratus ATCC 43197]SPX03428.1 Uncharacterised protein [Enterococcus malodoratus]STD69198.1 Uncharacterised protein [Enterococcus malodoratus]